MSPPTEAAAERDRNIGGGDGSGKRRLVLGKSDREAQYIREDAYGAKGIIIITKCLRENCVV